MDLENCNYYKPVLSSGTLRNVPEQARLIITATAKLHFRADTIF